MRDNTLIHAPYRGLGVAYCYPVQGVDGEYVHSCSRYLNLIYTHNYNYNYIDLSIYIYIILWYTYTDTLYSVPSPEKQN